MATYYVDSNATGLNDGSSWTDAWTSIGSATGVAAGDDVLVADNHAETPSFPWPTFANGDPNNPIRFVSTNTSTGVYSAGATLNSASNAGISGSSILMEGFNFNLVYGFSTGGSSSVPRGDVVIFRNCVFSWNTTSNQTFAIGNYLSLAILESCTLGNTSSGLLSFSFSGFASRKLIAKNCLIEKFQTLLVGGSYYEYSGSHYFSNCEFPDTDYIVDAGATIIEAELHNCKMKTGFALFDAPPYDEKVAILNSSDGTLSNPEVGITKVGSARGEVTSSTSAYRSSGANDGTQDYSWQMISTSVAKENKVFLEAIPITKYVQSGSQTITVYIAGGSSLNNDDFWIEVESPSELASPTAQGKFRTTKPNPLATPTALTSDTSSWTGTGVGTKQKIEVAISPTIAGTVTVRCYLAKPSTTVYVDPKISTDGYQRVFNGVLVDGDAVGGGGGAVLHPLRSN